MTRKDFIKMCGILGIGMPMHTVLTGCKKESLPINKVIVIGAGAGGMSAAYLLQQQGIEVEILEASSVYGGRMKINTDFADFPIPMGSEWIETDLGIFDEIVNDSSVNVDIQTVPDNPDRKFVNYSWFEFFEDYVLPSISSKINFNTIVSSIDYSGDQVKIQTINGERTADRVVVSIPLQILKDGDIDFNPALPSRKQNAINDVRIWQGFKAFFEFSEKFYSATQIPVNPETEGQKWFYDAAYGQNTTKNILGLFVVGTPANDYFNLTGNALRDQILGELDALFNGQATPSYVKHISQNWNNEPHIRGGYLTDHANYRDVAKLGESIDDKVYFAGGPYTDGNDWVSVHAAARSAKSAINEMVG